VLRGLGAPYAILPSGAVSNQIRIKIVNRDGVDRRYRIEVDPVGPDAGAPLQMIAPDNPLPVAAGKSATATVFLNAAPESFAEGRRDVRFRVTDETGWSSTVSYHLLGPDQPRRGLGGASRGGPTP
jgi:hypothetical protein